jgi:hypothetical protein
LVREIQPFLFLTFDIYKNGHKNNH